MVMLCPCGRQRVWSCVSIIEVLPVANAKAQRARAFYASPEGRRAGQCGERRNARRRPRAARMLPELRRRARRRLGRWLAEELPRGEQRADRIGIECARMRLLRQP